MSGQPRGVHKWTLRLADSLKQWKPQTCKIKWLSSCQFSVSCQIWSFVTSCFVHSHTWIPSRAKIWKRVRTRFGAICPGNYRTWETLSTFLWEMKCFTWAFSFCGPYGITNTTPQTYCVSLEILQVFAELTSVWIKNDSNIERCMKNVFLAKKVWKKDLFPAGCLVDEVNEKVHWSSDVRVFCLRASQGCVDLQTIV